ncbi:MAG: rRNA pseudouridine synthase [Candidatus Omnitrophica bacterium]|nr:rRNA pseudouridine synthase [Candidatus Omnitrophota bacterium]
MRLQVFLSRNGVSSRREALEIVKAGTVEVNGTVIDEPSFEVDPTKDRVMCKGITIEPKPYKYILMNKPKNVTTTKFDPHATKTVYDILPKHFNFVAPVGRLDRDTEGLLLLTNDGDVAHALTHPSFKVEKTYYACVEGRLDGESKTKLETGVYLDGIKTAPCHIQILRKSKEMTEVRITLHEGRNRQVRRMFAKVKTRVKFLQRIEQGPLKLGNSKPGWWRELTTEEVAALKEIVQKNRLKEEQVSDSIVTRKPGSGKSFWKSKALKKLKPKQKINIRSKKVYGRK